MTQNTAQTNIDPTRVEEFAGRLLLDLAAAAGTASTVLGDRLGLFAAMAGAGPVTATELAAATRLNERLLTEWLATQAVSGYLTYNSNTDSYELPAEHAMVLAQPDSPAYIVAAGEVVGAQYLTLDLLEQAFRGDGGIDYDTYPHSMSCGIERFFRTAYMHQLPEAWFPLVPGLVERLEAGVRVADIGCGHGVASLLMAERWPRSSYMGIDYHEPSIATARAKAVEAGSPENVTFRLAEAADLGSDRFDVILYLDALHDLGDPVASLRSAHDSLTEGGVVLAVEPWSGDRLEDSIGNPVARLNYAVSTSVCTPGSLGQPGAYGLGTSGGPEKRLALLAEAGFRDPFLAADTGLNVVVAATK